MSPRCSNEVVWRETHGRHAAPDAVTAHAIEGESTLCGKPARVAPWRDTGRGQRCGECITALSDLPVGYQEMLEVSGVSYRTVHYWSQKGYLRPSNAGCGSGRDMTWPASEVQVALVMRVAGEAGVGPGGAARAARDGGWLAPGVRLVIDRDDVQLGQDHVGDEPR